jgi:PAT family beta-lactamase induction signal transducer AmpG
MTLEQGGHPPSLSESAGYRYLAFGALYVAQGLPAGLLTVTFPAWLVQQGRGAVEIGGLIAFATLPWSIRLLWALALDRYGYLPMGRRRPWIILAQFGLCITFVILALVPDPAANLKLLSLMGFTLSFFSSLQDVATDGLAVDVLPAAQRGRANGVMYGGGLAGFSLASAGGSALLNQYGLSVVALTGAGLVGLILLFPLLLRERPGERLLPWTHGEASVATRQLRVERWWTMMSGVLRAVVLPASLAVLGLAFLSRLPDGIMRVIYPVLVVQHLGWANAEYSQLIAVFGVVSAVSGLIIGATVIDRLGALRTIVIATLLEVVVEAMFGLLSSWWTIRPVLIGFVMVRAVLSGAGTVAFFALCMTLCWKRVAATQFALYMAVLNSLSIAAGAGIAGWVSGLLDYPQIFLARAGVEVVLLALLLFVNLENHEERITALDAAQVAEA